MKRSFPGIVNKPVFLAFLFLFGCTPAPKTIRKNKPEPVANLQTLAFRAEEAPEWTALFNRESGWIGADGIFSIPLNGKEHELAKASTKTMLLFSDTLIGEIRDSTLQPGLVMVNNTVAFLKGSSPQADQLSFAWHTDAAGKAKALFAPGTPSARKGDYFWLGDGFVNTEQNNTTYIFAYRMRNLDNSKEWSFKEMGTDLIALPAESLPPFKNQRQIETPLRFEDGGFGAGIYVNTKKAGAPNPDGYVYVYGVRGQAKNLMVARVLPANFEDFKKWRFWNGQEWQADMQQAGTVTEGVSNELSLSALPDGRYALVFTLGGMGATVGLRLAQTPYGPFGPVIKIWEAKEPQRKNYFTYNAKAHPTLSAPGELLISYNVNAFNFLQELNINPNLYRPRFIRLKFQ